MKCHIRNFTENTFINVIAIIKTNVSHTDYVFAFDYTQFCTLHFIFYATTSDLQTSKSLNGENHKKNCPQTWRNRVKTEGLDYACFHQFLLSQKFMKKRHTDFK